jgi:hypothetical protein
MFKGFFLNVLIFSSSFIFAQSKIIGEELKLIFSEYFVDPSDNFPRTGKADAKFWATYGDGYYYMEHKIDGYTAILAKQPKTKPDFGIKCKIMLGPSSNNMQSVGLLFAMNHSGKNALVFEFNRKKEFRVRDLQGNIMSNSWVKSKLLKPAEIYQKIEIKCYNMHYEIFVQDKLIFSFSDDRFEGGRYGVIIGPLSLSKMDYFNVYDLTIPGRPATVPTKKLIERIDSLEKNNEFLRRELVEKKFNTKDQSMIEVITTMEKRIETLVLENKELKSIVSECENNPLTVVSDQVKSDVDLNLNKINTFSAERDELLKKLDDMEILLSNLKKEKLENEEALKSLLNNKKTENDLNNTENERVDEFIGKQDGTIKNNEKVSSENNLKEVVNNTEKYFPAIDELKIPVKKSTLK